MSMKTKLSHPALYGVYGIIALLCIMGALRGIYVLAKRSQPEPVVYTVHCDDELIVRVEPHSHISGYRPTLQINGKHRGVSWYDGTNTKHWVDVSHCGHVKIKPWKLSKVGEQP